MCGIWNGAIYFLAFSFLKTHKINPWNWHIEGVSWQEKEMTDFFFYSKNFNWVFQRTKKYFSFFPFPSSSFFLTFFLFFLKIHLVKCHPFLFFPMSLPVFKILLLLPSQGTEWSCKWGLLQNKMKLTGNCRGPPAEGLAEITEAIWRYFHP